MDNVDIQYTLIQQQNITINPQIFLQHNNIFPCDIELYYSITQNYIRYYFRIQAIVLYLQNHTSQMIIDLTQQFKKLAPQGFLPNQHQQIGLPIQAKLCYTQADDVKSSLKKINSILMENKQNYFSNAAYSYSAFTDQQRNQFDREMKGLLDVVNIKIGQLKQVVDRIKFNNTTQKQHLKSMTVCLYHQFKKVFHIFREFMEFNQNRKKKLQSMLGNQVKKQFKQIFNEKQKSPSKSKLTRKISNIDPQLEQQSKMIFMEKMSEQKKIEQTKKKLEQINEILDVMENKVLDQQLLTSSFRQIGQVGLFHIEKGNKNLVQANTISKDTGRLWTLFFLGLAFSLLFLDYIKS